MGIIIDLFFTSKMIKRFYNLYADVGFFFSDKDFGDVTLCFNEMIILNVNLNNINFDNNFDEDINTIILIRLLGWHIKLQKRKALEKK